MKKVYVICDNHMDLSWRRCFEDHFNYHGTVVRPYEQMEEALIMRYLSIMEDSDVKYSIEQSLSLKKFLERNPDKYENIKELSNNGRFEFLGGGESIIDYNMVCGESIVRNHFYSIKWYEENFCTRPHIGCATDTFGLSANLPQIFTQLGYDNILIYSRVFQNGKRFFKGLNGDLVYIRYKYDGVGRVLCADYRKYEACRKCKGEGCHSCGFSGFDLSHKIGLEPFDKVSAGGITYESCFEKIAALDTDTVVFQINTEEAMPPENLTEILGDLAKKYDCELEYVCYQDMYDKYAKKYTDQLKNETVSEDDIDERSEGNTISTGCYVSREYLKKANRELEDLLLSAEKLATFAKDYGMTYPRKKIARLWSKMSFIQFHDCITASHVDASYNELLRHIRDVRLGAGQIYHDALKTIEKNMTIPEKEGYTPMVVFNPLNWEVKDAIFECTMPRAEGANGVEIIDSDDNKMNIISAEDIKSIAATDINVKFFGNTSLKSMAMKIFYYKYTNDVCIEESTSSNAIENEFYKIGFGKCGIEYVFDKELNENILKSGAGALVAEEDYGSPWETLIMPYFHEDITKIPDVKHEIYVGNGYKSIRISGSYTNERRKIKNIDFVHTITLYDGIKKVFFKTDVDWDTVNSRLKVKFPLSFKPKNDEAYYEIPYGVLKRPSYEPVYGIHTSGNGDWPAINSVSVVNEEKGYTVSLLNKGIVANMVKDGVLYLSLLRSPDVPVFIFDFDGAKDKGKHTFEYQITSSAGNMQKSNAVKYGAELNTQFVFEKASCKKATIQENEPFFSNESENIIISAIKRCEDDDSIVVRGYEYKGTYTKDVFSHKNLYEVNLLEDGEKAVEVPEFSPYEIKTFKIK